MKLVADSIYEHSIPSCRDGPYMIQCSKSLQGSVFLYVHHFQPFLDHWSKLILLNWIGSFANFVGSGSHMVYVVRPQCHLREDCSHLGSRLSDVLG